MPLPAGYTIDPQPQPVNLPAGYTLDQPTALDLTNKQGEGTYQMTDKSGKSAAVPYGQVQQAAQMGYSFADDASRQRFNKDFSYATTGPGHEAEFAQSDKNAPLPMQLANGAAKGLATMYKPALDVVGAATGVPQESIDASLEGQTPTEQVGKWGTLGAMAAPAFAGAPVAAVGGVVGGTVAGTGANVIARAAGASPRTTDLVTDAAGLAGGAAGAMGARPLVSALDFSAQKQAAGALLQSVAQDANKVPVELENASEGALRLMDWQKKTNLGPTINKFLNRITSPNQGPLTYEDARDYYQLLGKLSVEETNKLAPPAQRALTQLVAGLKQDIGNAADTVGRAADYYKGLGDYATASKYEGWADSAKDFLVKEGIRAAAKGAGTIAGGTAAYGLWKWLTGK